MTARIVFGFSCVNVMIGVFLACGMRYFFTPDDSGTFLVIAGFVVMVSGLIMETRIKILTERVTEMKAQLEIRKKAQADRDGIDLTSPALHAQFPFGRRVNEERYEIGENGVVAFSDDSFEVREPTDQELLHMIGESILGPAPSDEAERDDLEPRPDDVDRLSPPF